MEEYGEALITAADQPAVQLETVWRHLQLDRTEADARAPELERFRAAATDYVERATHRTLITQTWEVVLPCFPDGAEIELPRYPLQSVTSVKYIDDDGDEQTFDSAKYEVDETTMPGQIVLDPDESWPSTRAVRKAVTVRYVAGYGDTYESIPPTATAYILWKAEDFFKERGTIEVGTRPIVVPKAEERIRAMLLVPRVP